PRLADRRGERDHHERGAVVEERLAFHDRGELMRDARAPEREEHAHRVGDRQERAEQERERERQSERERRDDGGPDERDRDARDREREDRPPRFAQRIGIGAERALEDEERQESEGGEAGG